MRELSYEFWVIEKLILFIINHLNYSSPNQSVLAVGLITMGCTSKLIFTKIASRLEA
jgi:hypothetical protein